MGKWHWGQHIYHHGKYRFTYNNRLLLEYVPADQIQTRHQQYWRITTFHVFLIWPKSGELCFVWSSHSLRFLALHSPPHLPSLGPHYQQYPLIPPEKSQWLTFRGWEGLPCLVEHNSPSLPSSPHHPFHTLPLDWTRRSPVVLSLQRQWTEQQQEKWC